MVIFDVIVPTFNNKEELLKCLSGFSKQTLPPSDFRVFVCLDGSTDGSKEALESYYPFEIMVLEHPDKKNHGRNATRNLALNHLDSQFVLFFDSDLVPYPYLLENHFKLLRDRTCISMGNVDYLNKEENDWALYTSNRGYNKFRPMALMPIEYLNMGNVALSTHFLLELGGMDEKLKHYGGDDTELSLRIEMQKPTIVINNAQARGHCILTKTLEQGLLQTEEFGRINLKYIEKKYDTVYNEPLYKGSNISRIKNFLIVNITNGAIHPDGTFEYGVNKKIISPFFVGEGISSTEAMALFVDGISLFKILFGTALNSASAFESDSGPIVVG